jgi:hypothetical protein
MRVGDLMRIRRSKRDWSPVDTAWRIHDAQMDWTGKVDAKAAFALTIHSALLALAVALFSGLDEPLAYGLYATSCVLLIAGAILAAVVVSPRLRSKGLAKASRRHSIYFGHARHLSAEQLEQRLRLEEPLPQIAQQIVVMADIAWAKHVRAAWSIWLGVAGGIALLATALLTRC